MNRIDAVALVGVVMMVVGVAGAFGPWVALMVAGALVVAVAVAWWWITQPEDE